MLRGQLIFFSLLALMSCDWRSNGIDPPINTATGDTGFDEILRDSVGIKEIVLGMPIEELKHLLNDSSCTSGIYNVGFSCWSIDKKISVAGIECDLTELDFWNGGVGKNRSHLTRAELMCPAGVENILGAVRNKYGPNSGMVEDPEERLRSWKWEFPSKAHLMVWQREAELETQEYAIVLNAGLWPKQMKLRKSLELKDI